MTYCPRCGLAPENYSNAEGGWCPECEAWFPPDLVEEAMEERWPWEYVTGEDPDL